MRAYDSRLLGIPGSRGIIASPDPYHEGAEDAMARASVLRGRPASAGQPPESKHAESKSGEKES